MLSFARVFVLCGGVVLITAVIANLNVGGAGANCHVVSKAVASGTLYERFRVDGNLHSDALVVHVSWFSEELTER